MKANNKKASSTSTIFLNETISNPNFKKVIRAVSTLLHSIIIEDIKEGKTISSDSDLYYFCEDKFILDNPGKFEKDKLNSYRKTPLQNDIFEFIEAFYDLDIFNSEGCIISFIYINRLIAITEMPLIQTNWRPIIFFSIVLAQKIYDEAFISNQDFSLIYPFYESKHIAVLENKFLELMKYNTVIKFSTYSKYYLELKSLLPSDDILKPLDKISFSIMEKQSKYLQDKFKTKSKTGSSNKQLGENTKYVIN